MKDMSTLRTQLAIPPLPIYFIGVSLVFAVVAVVLRQAVVHDTSFSFLDGLAAGCLFGAIMAGSVAASRWRLRHAVGAKLTPEQLLQLNWSVEHLVLPQDTRLCHVFPAYLRYLYTINRHSRVYIPILLGICTIGSIILYASTAESLWLLYAGLFTILGYIGVRGVNRSIRNLRLIAPRLHAVPKRQLAPKTGRHAFRPIAPHTV